MPPEVELTMYRIAQEAVRNVERHSKVNRVRVVITFAEREARLRVHDNGVGFAMSADLLSSASTPQLGLLGMYERARLLGGWLTIQSASSTGATVTASLPVNEH